MEVPGPSTCRSPPRITSSKFISAWNSRGWPKSVLSGSSKTVHSLNPFSPGNTLLGHPLEFQAEINLLLVTTGPSGPENGPRASINRLPQVTHTRAGIPLLHTCRYTSLCPLQLIHCAQGNSYKDPILGKSGLYGLSTSGRNTEYIPLY